MIDSQKPYRVLLDTCRTQRNSGIELLKILVIFLIIISHLNQTLTTYSDVAPSYVINLKEFSLSNPRQSLILYFFQQFGALGNSVFFVCSAWFLTDSKRRYGKKIVTMIIEVWAVSVTILIVVLLTKTVELNNASILRCIMPLTFSNNWYVTNYCLFHIIVPFLNLVIDKLSQKQHLVLAMYIIILLIAVVPFTLEWSKTIPGLTIDKWIVIYFIIAYMKRYLPRSSSSTTQNVFLLLLGMGGYAICVLVNTYDIKQNALMIILATGWQVSQFYLYAIAIGLFNLFRKIDLHSPMINRISGYSLLIYIIHENLLIRSFYRPIVLTYIQEKYGYDRIVIWIILLALATFICSLVLSILFDLTLGKMAKQVTEKFYTRISASCSRILDKMVRFC